jgi:hypothetical protein
MMARASRLVAAALVTVVSLHVAPVRAGVEPLKRSVENITQGPLDFALTPFVAGQTAYRNIRADQPTAGGRIVLGFFTYVGLLMVDAAAAGFRTWTGFLEFPVGLGALAATPFTDKDLPAFFDVKQSRALVDHPTKVFDVKFGVYHAGGSE